MFICKHTTSEEIMQECSNQFAVIDEARAHRLARYDYYYTSYNNSEIPPDMLDFSHRWTPFEELEDIYDS